MWYPDLEFCDFIPAKTARVLAVGWLDSRHSFPTGPVDDLVVAKLRALLETPWQPGIFLGWHDCEFCPSGVVPATGVRNVFVPKEKCIYAAPEMIVHYIEAHGYRPPPVFQEAVLECPKMRSEAYFEALVAAGAREASG